jgi:tape measure domain-containing protein
MSSPVVGQARLVINPQYGDIRGPLKKEFDKGSQQFKQHGQDAGKGFTSGFGARVKDTEKVAEDTGRRGGIRFVSGFTSRIGPRAFSASTGVLTSSLSGVAGAATASGLALAGAATAGVAAGTALGIKTAASMEQASVAFETLLGSAGKSKAFLGDLSKFAAATPFTFPGLVDASRQLIGVGQSASSVIPTLTAWGDTAGALGLSQDQFSHSMLALTQAMGNGKLQAGDLLQITQAGIPIWSILAKALGKPVSEVRKMSEEGKLLTADVLPKLEKQMGKDYGGAMAKQSKTLTGIWSTFTDTLSMGLATAVTPLIPALKTGLTGAIGVVGGALGALPRLGAKVGPVFREIKGDVSAFIAAFKAGDGDITSSGFAGKMEAIGLKTRTAFDFIKKSWHDVVTGFQGGSGSDAVGKLGGVFVSVGSAVRTGLTWIQKTPDALRAVGSAADKYVVPSLRNLGDFVAQSVIPSIRNLAGFFSVLLPAVKPVAIIVGITLVTAFRVLSILLANVIGPAIRGVTGFLSAHRTIVTSVAITIGTLIAVTKAYQLGVAAVMLVQRLFTAGMLIAKGAVLSMRVAVFLLNSAFLANPIGIVVLALVALAAGFVYAYKHSETFRNIVQTAWLVIRTAAQVAWDSYLKPVFGFIVKAVQIVGKEWTQAGHTFGTIWDGIKGAFRIGVTFALGYIDKILEGFQGMLSAAGHLPGPLGAPFKKAAGAIQEARDKIKGLQDGINATHGKTVGVGVKITAMDAAGGAVKGSIFTGAAAAGHAIGFADGGFVKGPWRGPRADNVLARLNPKEFVVQAPAAEAIERRNPGFLAGVVNRFHELDIGGDPSGAWIGGSGKSGIPGRALGGWISRLPGLAMGGVVGAVQRWLPSVDPRPYIWGGVGPGGYDCSGLVGEVYNRLLGLRSFVRRFTTANESSFFKPGKGTFTVGINPGQHTAGNIGGLAFEAASTKSGIHVGSSAQPVTRFQRVMYLPELGNNFVAAGGGNPPDPLNARALSRIAAAVAPYAMAGVLHDIGFTVRDTGGRWPSGTLAYNGTGSDEYVYRSSQAGASGMNLTLHVDARGAHDPAAVEAAVERGGARLLAELARMMAQDPGVN